MGTEIGTETAGIAKPTIGELLAEDACSFEFFQAVALLQRLNEAKGHVGGFAALKMRSYDSQPIRGWHFRPARSRV